MSSTVSVKPLRVQIRGQHVEAWFQETKGISLNLPKEDINEFELKLCFKGEEAKRVQKLMVEHYKS